MKQRKRFCKVKNYALQLLMHNVQSHSLLRQRHNIDLDINTFVTFFSNFVSICSNVHVKVLLHIVLVSHDQLLYLNNICVCSALMWFIVFCVFEKDLVHICAGILEQFVTRVENDQSNLTVTENAQFIRFLH